MKIKTMVHEFDEAEFDAFLQLIKEKHGYNFTEYAKASLHRRVSRFLLQKNLLTLQELSALVEADTNYFENLLTELTVNVTEMFRDPHFYKILRSKVIPQLKTYPHVKVWSAGCSSGEEIYSLAILFKEEQLKKVKIYATDINQKVLAKAKEGIYPVSYIKDYSKNYLNAGGLTSLSDYYHARYNNVIFDEALKSNITFSAHNLSSDSPFNEFNLIVCRNVMIYFQKELQEKVLELFLNSLPIFGYLALGNKESLTASKFRKNFEVVDHKEKIYRRIA